MRADVDVRAGAEQKEFRQMHNAKLAGFGRRGGRHNLRRIVVVFFFFLKISVYFLRVTRAGRVHEYFMY